MVLMMFHRLRDKYTSGEWHSKNPLCFHGQKKVEGVMGLGILECDRLLVRVPGPQCVLER